MPGSFHVPTQNGDTADFNMMNGLLYLYVYNNSGVTLNQGDLVILDKSYTSGLGVTLTTTQADKRAIGVVMSGVSSGSTTIASGAYGYVAVGNVQKINVTGAVAWGHALVASTTSHYAMDSGAGSSVVGSVGFSLGTQASGNGQISALIEGNPTLFNATLPNVEGSLFKADGASGALQCGSNPSRAVICMMWVAGTGTDVVNAAPSLNSVTGTLLYSNTFTPTCTMYIYGWNGNNTGSLTAVAGTATGTGGHAGCHFVAMSGVLQGAGWYSTAVFGTSALASFNLTDGNLTVPDLIIGMFVGMGDISANSVSSRGGNQTMQTTDDTQYNTLNYTLSECDSAPALSTSQADSWVVATAETDNIGMISVHSA